MKRNVDPDSKLELIVASAVGGAVMAGIFVAALVAIIVAGGWYDVGASTGHSAPVAWFLHTTMIRSVGHYAKEHPVPASFSSTQMQEGFRLYDTHCAECHGGPGIARAQWVNGLTPGPPYLIDAARRWTPAELHFIVANGVKMTAMPAWEMSQPPEHIAAIVAFLEQLPDVTTARYAQMRAQAKQQKAKSESGSAAQMAQNGRRQ